MLNTFYPRGSSALTIFFRKPLLNCIRKTQTICVNQNIFQKGVHSWYKYYYSICMSFLFITPITSTRTKVLKSFYINVTRFRERPVAGAYDINQWGKNTQRHLFIAHNPIDSSLKQRLVFIFFFLFIYCIHRE